MSIVGATSRTLHSEALGLHCIHVTLALKVNFLLFVDFLESEGRNSSVPYTSAKGL